MQEGREKLQAVAARLGADAEFGWRYNAVMETEGWHLDVLEGQRLEEWLGHTTDDAVEAFEARFNRVFYP